MEYIPFSSKQKVRTKTSIDEPKKESRRSNLKENHKVVRLHEEIVDFAKNVSPTPSERKSRSEVIFRIKKAVYDLWPNSELDVFGSYRTDLYLPCCDIDIVVFGKWKKKPLHTLRNHLVQNKISKDENALVIEKAKVPIIKIIDTETQIKVDISFNTTSGISSALKIKKLLKMFPMAKPLILVLKQFLLQRELNEVYSGGLSSYGLMLLVFSFFQLHARNKEFMLPQKKKFPRSKDFSNNLGVLLLEFLELYGLHFNYYKTGIRLKILSTGQMKGSYFRRPSTNRTYGISVLDPNNDDEETNDVTKGSYNFFLVQTAFKHAFLLLSHQIFSSKSSQQLLSLIVNDPR